MAIQYSAADNKITVTGYSEATPCTFEDIYQADKAGTLTLIDRDGMNSTDANPVNNTYNLCPADEKLLGGAKHDLYIVVESWNATSATVRLIGTNENGDSLTEDINITGNGTYYASDLFKTLTQTQITAFTGTSFDYSLVQGQWGVVWKQGDYQFQIDSATISISGWLKDYGVQAYFTEESTAEKIKIETDGHLILGDPLGNLLGTSITFWGNGVFKNHGIYNLGETIIYNSLIQDLNQSHFLTNIEAKYCVINNVRGLKSGTFNYCYIFKPRYGLTISPPFDFDLNNTFIDNSTYMVVYHGTGTKTLHNLICGDTGNFYIHNDHYELHFVNSKGTWKGICPTHGCTEEKYYREYTLDLKVINENGDTISGATVKIWDKNDNLVVDTTTANGIIPTQTLVHSDYQHTPGGGNYDYTQTMHTPHTLQISKAGYQTYKKKFTLDEKIDWRIRLRKITEVNLSKRARINY